MNAYSLWCTFFFIQFVNGLAERYPEIFDGDGASSQHQANFAKKWSSYTTIVELANGDITKFDSITKEPLEKCFLYLCYRTDKSQVAELIHRESIAKMRNS